jgi:RNA polymerase sigma factor (sigma-70 family)
MEDQQDWNAYLERVGKDGDRAAYTELFTHFAPMLKAFLLKSGSQNMEQVEELVQETMIKVWRKAKHFNPSQGKASTWIYTIARNTRIDSIRKQVRQNPNLINADDLYDSDAIVTPHKTLIELRNRRNIRVELKNLPQAQAEILSLMYFQGQSGQQVANALNIPLGTVKSRVRLAMEKLKLSLASHELDIEQDEGKHS